MSTNAAVPDAWDDDYDNFVAIQKSKPAVPAASKPASRAQRKAQHVEANRALWDSAENPETFHFVDAKNDVPLKSAPKTAMRVLSRKPKQDPPNLAVRQNAGSLTSGMASLELGHEDDVDSEEEERRAKERGFKERQEQARIEREEKQRKYKEVRERLFGSEKTTPSSQGGNSSPPRPNSGHRQRPSRGGRKPGEGGILQPSSSTDQSPARGPIRDQKQLFEPEYAPKPGSTFLQNREKAARSPQPESQHVRQPRGPDGSGGFGFATRETTANAT